ncbi:hypothetical protein [Pseudomonas sp.]|jgi:hypothetical protein|uniref:hypothetical protein n=1 Tax=Pseudomonas sp. TaxID=306 RepID=UPI002ED85D9D
MKGLAAAFLAVFLVGAPSYSIAGEVGCDTYCDDACPSVFGIPEPSCYGSCLSLKAAAQASGCIIQAPFPDQDPRQILFQTCAVPFVQVVAAVIAECSNEKGLENHELIQQAVIDLSRAHALDPSTFNGVEIRWCNLRNGTLGITPDKGRIYLDVSLTGNRLLTAANLAHEAIHLGQYRKIGSEGFKCEYSRDMAGCGGCQDRGNALEKEAYEFQDRVTPTIRAYLNRPPLQPTQPNGSLPSGATTFQCGCPNTTQPFVPDPQCASGVAEIAMCPGFCGNGSAVTYHCQ